MSLESHCLVRRLSVCQECAMLTRYTIRTLCVSLACRMETYVSSLRVSDNKTKCFWLRLSDDFVLTPSPSPQVSTQKRRKREFEGRADQEPTTDADTLHSLTLSTAGLDFYKYALLLFHQFRKRQKSKSCRAPLLLLSVQSSKK